MALVAPSSRVTTHFDTDLRTTFREGAAAATFAAPELTRVYHEILGDRPDLLPWNQPLGTLAREHTANNVVSGSMFRFVPGGIGHVARKYEIHRTSTGLAVTLGGRPSDDLDDAWTSAVWNRLTDLLARVAGPLAPARYHCTLELLQYPADAAEFDRICELLADSGGRWTRLGAQLDANRLDAHIRRPRRGWPDLYAALSMVPLVRRAAAAFNQRIGNPHPADVHHGPRRLGDAVAGAPHLDGGKLLTVLVGDRQTLRTEVAEKGRYRPLEMTDRSAHLIMGGEAGSIGLTPTHHRVIYAGPAEAGSQERTTLVCSLVAH